MVPAVFIGVRSGAFRQWSARENTMSRESGKIGEDVAVKFLRRHGYEIIDRNYRGSRYEVDIVAREGGVLSFIEVKTRAPGKSLSGAESINREKQRRIAQAAQHYLLTHPQERSSVCRFDVVLLEAVAGKKPVAKELLKNAFQ